MLQQIDTVTISSLAATEFKKILTEKKMEGAALRVYVAGGGCSGVNFGMAIENNIREEDITFADGEVKVVVDNQSIEYLRGASINFINDPQRGTGFIVEGVQPISGGCSCNSNGGGSSCGCGSEGGHAHSHSEGGCGCGGSCSCNN